MCQSSASHAHRPSEACMQSETLSRACTLEAELNILDASGADEVITHNWALRLPEHNDFFLRASFQRLIEESADLSIEHRLIAYDACDEYEVKAKLGMFRKRLDARRNTKPKKIQRSAMGVYSLRSRRLQLLEDQELTRAHSAVASKGWHVRDSF